MVERCDYRCRTQWEETNLHTMGTRGRLEGTRAQGKGRKKQESSKEGHQPQPAVFIQRMKVIATDKHTTGEEG